MRKTPLRTKVLLGMVLGLSVAVVLKLPKPPPSPEAVARDAVAAFARKDYAGVLRLQCPDEFKLSGMTERQWTDILRWAREEVLGSSQFEAVQRTFEQSKQWGVAALSLREGKRSADLYVYSTSASGGRKVLVSNLVMQAVFARAILDGETSEDSPWQLYRVATSKKLRGYLPRMRQLGLTGLYSGGPNPKWRTLDQFAADLERTERKP